MTRIFLFALILGLFPGGDKDSPVEEAKDQFRKGNYAKAILEWAKAEEKFKNEKAAIEYNIGQCYLEIDSLRLAGEAFRNGLDKDDPELSSMSLNNIGVLQAKNEQFEAALESFKDALRKFAGNEEARKNYELTKRILKKKEEENKKNQQRQQQMVQNQGGGNNNQNSPNQSPSPLPPENQTGTHGDMTLEEAQRQLDEMDSKEQQFLQQLQRNSPRMRSNPGESDHDW